MMRLPTATSWTTAVVIACTTLAGAPAAFSEPSVGGAAAPSSSDVGATPADPQNTLQPPSGGVLVRHTALLRGKLTAAAGRPVVLELLGSNHAWGVVARGLTSSDGSFAARWRATHIGRFTLRARLDGASSSSVEASPSALVEVYRPVVATFFGPGSYGSRTACGQKLTPALLGVAHRSLPCGTPVDIVYGGHTITVPVVDRGPYASGVSYDLTAATAHALGIDGTVHLGALALRGTVTPAG